MNDNILTRQAFSIQSNKGVYALFLGSGISRSSGVLTGWDIVLDLITKYAATIAEDVNDKPHEWYVNKFGTEPDYSVLLEKLIATPVERMKLLKKYFENDSFANREVKPTKAHQYIAKLLKEKYIKVVVTTNFDRLLEKALLDEGINSYSITHSDDIKGMQPLVHIDHVIIKVNGDYLDSRFLNTKNELSDYPAPMRELLNEVFCNFGLITCGWSAQWDIGLVNTLKSINTFRYPYCFTYVGKCETELSDLAIIRKGEILQINDADTYFYTLYEKISALERVNAMNPMSKDIIVARAKKYAKDSSGLIELEELVENEVNKAYKKIDSNANYDRFLDKHTFVYFKEIHTEAITVLQPLLFTITRWAKEEHHDIILFAIRKLSTPPYQTGKHYSEETVQLHYLASTLLFYSIGISALVFKKYKLLDKLFKLKKPDNVVLKDYERLLIKNVNGCAIEHKKMNQLLGTNTYTPYIINALNNCC
ncbi:hypothetical protein EZS27_026428 [termite gut metagenome]|uniref:Uncharacterized protein n=1 Tax=termite gut metagenome TaxID=433724 RepID=A0A5J4QQV2_9ZZZZ